MSPWQPSYGQGLTKEANSNPLEKQMAFTIVGAIKLRLPWKPLWARASTRTSTRQRRGPKHGLAKNSQFFIISLQKHSKKRHKWTCLWASPNVWKIWSKWIRKPTKIISDNIQPTDNIFTQKPLKRHPKPLTETKKGLRHHSGGVCYQWGFRHHSFHSHHRGLDLQKGQNKFYPIKSIFQGETARVLL